LVFSLVPRCQGLCGSQKYTFTLVATVNSLCLAISKPRSQVTQLLNQHLLRDAGHSSTQFREAEHGRTEKVEQYENLPSSFKDFQGLF
jgi:hypothetical protein